MAIEIRNKIDSCLSLLDEIDKSSISLEKSNLQKLRIEVLTLADIILEKYPAIAEELKKAIYQGGGGIDFDDSYILGEITASIEILNSLERPKNRIFISHSSQDEEVVSQFVDNILQLGIGMKAKDIFCTSIEDMGIANGDDIRRHILRNIRNSDFSFLLISKEYKKSEICLNEMGAVWACDSNVLLYILPDVDFDSIGWLYDTKKAEKIDDAVMLDALHKKLTDYYGLPDNSVGWSRQRGKFLDYFKLLKMLENI